MSEPPTLAPPAEAPDCWPIPQRLSHAAQERQLFPLATLPDWMIPWCQAVRESLQCPVDLPAVLGLAALSAAASKRFFVRYSGSYPEPLNLYLVVALPSGESKSPAFKMASRVIYDQERKLHRDWAAAAREDAERREQLGAAISRLEARYRKAKPEEDLDELSIEIAKLKDQLGPKGNTAPPRLVAEDVTPEGLVPILVANHERLALLSEEGGPFAILAGRYTGGQPNLELFNKAYSGSEYRYDRATRPSLTLHAPCLTLGLAVQPSVLSDLAQSKAAKDQGFLARMLYSLPASMVGHRRAESVEVPPAVQGVYDAGLRRLMNHKLAVDEDGLPVPVAFSLSSGARTPYLQFKQTLEFQLRAGAPLEHMADWVNKASGKVLRLAGLLHIAQQPSLEKDLMVTEISRLTMDRAITLVQYFLDHSMAAYELMGENTLLKRLTSAVAWIRRRSGESFRLKHLHGSKKEQDGFQTVDQVREVVALLVKAGYIRRVQEPPHQGPGRPRSPLYEINPALAEYGPQYPKNPGSVDYEDEERASIQAESMGLPTEEEDESCD